MTAAITQVINNLSQNPKKIFLVDSLGAFLTALLLVVILKTFIEYVGMPATSLTILIAIALVYFVYSMCCYLLVKNRWRIFLKLLIAANIVYCCLTMGLIIYFYSSLRFWGITYFLFEIAVVCILVYIEMKLLSGKHGNKE